MRWLPFAGVATLPALILSSVGVTTVGALVLLVVVGCVALRLVARRVSPKLAQGFFFQRLSSPRYTLLAVGVPLGSAVVVGRHGWLGLVVVVALHLALGYRYRYRLERPGALIRALPVAACVGFFGALQVLAQRGKEWRLGGRLLYAEESPRQRVVLVERDGSLDFLIDGTLQFRSLDERSYHRR